MTLAEAKKVAQVISKADNGCPVCVKELCELIAAQFPQYHWAITERGEVEVTAEKRP